MALSVKGVSRVCILPLLLSGSPAFAQTTTELVGNALSQFPFFEYVKAVNGNATVEIAIDPSRFPGIVGETCDIYVVEAKSASEWASTPGLIDITPGGAQTESFSGGSIQANTFQVTAPSVLNADAGTGLGVGYDVVLDCDQNGTLSADDFLDGSTGAAGFYAVHDITQPGPFSVVETEYNLTVEVAGDFDIPEALRSQNLFYPSNIGSLGKRPMIIIGHGSGHQFDWYDHIGEHLASYGYVVMSLDNHVGSLGGGESFAATTQLGHTDAFIELVNDGAIAGGALTGHIDTDRIVWIGHSQGGAAVVIAYNRLVTGADVPDNYSQDSIQLISSMLPTDRSQFGEAVDPHSVNYHLWTASGDSDVSSAAGLSCCQTFRILDRATGFAQGSIVQGSGHGWFHNGGGSPWIQAGAPCQLDEANVHDILLGHMFALVKHYVDGNIPAQDFLTRQYERFRPSGVSPTNACIVVTHEYRNGSEFGNLIIDDYQTGTASSTASSGASVTFDVQNVLEGILDDNNSDFNWTPTDPFNGAVLATTGDISRGVVFDWSNNRFYQWGIPSSDRDFTQYQFLSFRGSQGTQHPNTLAATGDLTFDVTLADGGTPTQSSTINIGAYGGGLEEPYARSDGGHNEMETVRLRLTDFLNNNSGLDLSDIVSIRFEFGPAHGSSTGRIVLDDVMLTNDVVPDAFEIIEPTTVRPAYAGTSTAGSRVLVRLLGKGGLDLSPGNLTVSVNNIALTPAQIPTAATNVDGETWLIIAPGPRPDGCYDLDVELTTPSGITDVETQSLCYNDAETHLFDRVLAIDKTQSMNYDGTTGINDPAKMEAARSAAKFFVNLSNQDDNIGVIAFQRRDQNDNGTIVEPDELAETVFPLSRAIDGTTDNRQLANMAIDGVSPDTSPGFSGPETSPGAALADGRTMLNTDGDDGHEKTIVLLSDGLENYEPFWSQPGGSGPLKPSFEADDIRIDTVGIGGDADDNILMDMANTTSGEFRNLNEGSGSYFLLSRLSSWYKAIDEDVRGEQRFFYREGFPKSSVATTHASPRFVEIPVEANLDWMTVAFHSNIEDAAQVRLFAPGSAVPILPTTPDVTVRADPKHVVYRITNPQGGIWRYVVDVKEPDAEFFAVASAPTLLAARTGPAHLTRLLSDEYSIPLRVWIADIRGVTGASITGFIRRPDGVKNPISLLDNGNADDGEEADGIYSHVYKTALPGSYWVEMVVNGVSTKGEPFQRFLSTSFVIPGADKKPEQYGEGLEPPGGTNTGQDSGHYEYAVKFLCGKGDGSTFSQGQYFTGVNVRNPLGVKVRFRKQFAIAFGQQRQGPVSDWVDTALGPRAAYEIDCPDIYQHAPIDDSFATGFVVIETPSQLDVVAVHTVSGKDGFVQTIDIEPIQPRQSKGCADLMIEDVQRPVWDSNTRESILRATVLNVGSVAASASRVRVIDPSTPDPAGQPYSDEDTVPALDPSESWVVKFRLPYWVYNPDVSLRYFADSGQDVDECDESNNEAVFEQRG